MVVLYLRPLEEGFEKVVMVDVTNGIGDAMWEADTMFDLILKGCKNPPIESESTVPGPAIPFKRVSF